jgi:phosphoglycerol transferase
VKGRESEWQDNLVKQPLEVMVAGMAAAGFDGLYVDRAGYADRAVQLERDLRGLLGPAQFESEDARLVMYDLRPVRRRLDATLSTTQARRTRDAILHPPQVQFGPGFSAEERDPATGTTWHWVQGRAELDIVNTTMHRQRVVISFDIASLTAGANVLVTGLAPGVVLPTPDGGTGVEREVTLAPGVNRVRFAADAADVRFQVVGFRVVAPGLSGVTEVVQAAPAAA